MEPDPGTPPDNADDWSNEQWIEWLKATDSPESVDEPHPATSAGRVAHSAGGQVLGSAMLGLAQALYGPQDNKPAVVVESGEPQDDELLELHVDSDHPDQSYVVVKTDRDAPEQ